MSEVAAPVLLVAAVCSAAVVGIGSASASPTAGRGKLVLAGVPLDFRDSAQDGLYVMNADGSGRRQITHDMSDREPYWSPDGRLIAFFRSDENDLADRLMVMRADGTAARSLGTSLGGNLETASPWSRDGTQIAWDGCGGLCIYSFSSSRRTRILLGQDDLWGFAWAPNGRALAAVDGEGRLVLVNTADRIVKVLASAGAYPAWSPNGTRIAFLAGHGNSAHTLKLVPATGGRARVLATDAEPELPSWSPDGRRLLYHEFRRHPFNLGLMVATIATRTTTRVGDGDGFARWSPDGTRIIYGRLPLLIGSGQDLWVVQPDGSGRRQLTNEFPTGLGYGSLDWTSGSVAATLPPPPQLLQLTATGDLTLDSVDVEIGRAPTPDSVVYRNDVPCGNPDAETFAATFTVWAPDSATAAATTAPCLDFYVYGYAVTASLDAWIAQFDLDGSAIVGVVRPGTTSTEVPPVAAWTSGREAPDIGWRTSIGPLVGDGSMIAFETTVNETRQLWRIADGSVPHAVPVPLPAETRNLIDAADGRILLGTTNGFTVLSADGSVLSRIPLASAKTVQIGGGLVGAVAGATLQVYDTDSGKRLYDLPLAHVSGVPRLLTISSRYAMYESGIELHLLRLSNGYDRTIDLPGQTGPLQALLTSHGVFVAYYHGYDPKPARLLFIPAANLP